MNAISQVEIGKNISTEQSWKKGIWLFDYVKCWQVAQLNNCQKLDFKGAGWRGQPQLGDAVPVLTITPQKNRFELWIHDMSNRWSPKH